VRVLEDEPGHPKRMPNNSARVMADGVGGAAIGRFDEVVLVRVSTNEGNSFLVVVKNSRTKSSKWLSSNWFCI
jgi:hypothetical protein